MKQTLEILVRATLRQIAASPDEVNVEVTEQHDGFTVSGVVAKNDMGMAVKVHPHIARLMTIISRYECCRIQLLRWNEPRPEQPTARLKWDATKFVDIFGKWLSLMFGTEMVHCVPTATGINITAEVKCKSNRKQEALEAMRFLADCMSRAHGQTVTIDLL